MHFSLRLFVMHSRMTIRHACLMQKYLVYFQDNLSYILHIVNKLINYRNRRNGGENFDNCEVLCIKAVNVFKTSLFLLSISG
jgi:hypothetical protein